MRFLDATMRVVDSLAFSHDGRRLYAAGTTVPDLRDKPDNRGIDVWDFAVSAAPAGHLLPDQIITGLVVNPANGWIYTGIGYSPASDHSSGYLAIEPATGKSVSLGLTAGNAFNVSVHPGGKWFVAAGCVNEWRNDHIICFGHSRRGKPAMDWDYHLEEGYYPLVIACDPVGRRIITQDLQRGKLHIDQLYELTIRDSTSGRVVERVPIPGRMVHHLLFSPDGTWLSLLAGKSILFWRAADLTRKPNKIRGSGKGHITGMAFHPSGRYLAAASNDQTVKLYDTTTWELAKTFTWDIGRMRSIAFSPDGTLAAAGSDSGKVVVWDVDL